MIYDSVPANELVKKGDELISRLLTVSIDRNKKKNIRKKAAKMYLGVIKSSSRLENLNYEFQLIGYERLGKTYFQRNDYINAIALYNFALAICQDENKNTTFIQSTDNYRLQLIQQIKAAERQFLISAVNQELSPSDYRLD